MTREIGKSVKKFGEKIRRLRTEKRLSQRALARKLNVVLGTIQLYEKGNTIPAADVVGRLARVFQVSTDYLIYDDYDALEKVQDRELMQYFVKADQLHHRYKYLVKEFVDSLSARQELEETVLVSQTKPQTERKIRDRRAA